MIRVSGTSRKDAIIYAIAEPDPDLAIEIIRAKVANPDQYVEDLGRVADDLIAALKLAAGEFKAV